MGLCGEWGLKWYGQAWKWTDHSVNGGGRVARLDRTAFMRSDEVRCGMRLFFSSLALSFCSGLCGAQTAVNDGQVLNQIRAKYDAPFQRNLEAFSCTVEFDWKQHFTEVVRLGDEGTDEEIANLIQPITTRVIVTRQNAVVSSGMTGDEERKLPHGGMAEGLLKHAVQYSLNNWLSASGTALLPPQGTSVHVEPSASGYKLGLRIQTFDVEMLFARDFALLSEGVKASPSDSRETNFHPGPQGFLLTSFRQGEDGDFRPGNKVVLTYTYQNVGGFQLPEQVAISRESHHENWHYKLSRCSVQTDK